MTDEQFMRGAMLGGIMGLAGWAWHAWNAKRRKLFANRPFLLVALHPMVMWLALMAVLIPLAIIF